MTNGANDEPANGAEGPGNGAKDEDSNGAKDDWKEFTRAGAAIALVVTAMSSLAVAGVLERVQRNHAMWLYVGLALVVVASVIWASTYFGKDDHYSWNRLFRRLTWLAVGIFGAAYFSGEAERVWQDDRREAVISALAIAAALAYVLSLFAPGGSQTYNSVMRVAGAIVLGAGLLFGTLAVTLALRDTARPSVTASIEPGPKLVGTIEVSGLRADEHLQAIVDAIEVKRNPNGEPVRVAGVSQLPIAKTERLYSVWLGPDSDGRVEHSLDLALPLRLRTRLASTRGSQSAETIARATNRRLRSAKLRSRRSATRPVGGIRLAVYAFV